MKLKLSRQIFDKKSLNTKFRQDPSSGIRVLLCIQTADMTKLIVAFRNFKQPPKNILFSTVRITSTITLSQLCTLSFCDGPIPRPGESY